MDPRSAVEKFLENHSITCSPESVRGNSSKLDIFLKYLSQTSDTFVDEKTLFRYRDWLLKKWRVSEGTAKQYLRVTTQLCRWLIRRGEIPAFDVPANFGLVTGAAERIPFTEEEYTTLLGAVQGKPDWEYAITMGWHTGFRIGDIATLKVKDVDFQNQCIRIVPRKTARRKERRIEMPVKPEVLEAIRKVAGSEHVSEHLASTYLSNPARVSLEFGRLAESAGVTGKSFHCFRHAFISRSLAQGAKPTLVAEVLGIELERVMTYAHTDLNSKRKALHG